MRLTDAEKDLIRAMCSIAEANFDIAMQNVPVRGEGDYEGWTEADFRRADAIFNKLFNPRASAKNLDV